MIGPVFYTSVFSYFTSDSAPFKFAGAPCATAFVVLLATTLVFGFFVREDKSPRLTTYELVRDRDNEKAEDR